ncbi:MAG TPA: PQQ-binding-like beta-propeller repeat protein [Vicinamibacterales bacterium]|nr:PQQ-binding-like beta-propeller repeat protein [Vicinamibacterales bacterium]
MIAILFGTGITGLPVGAQEPAPAMSLFPSEVTWAADLGAPPLAPPVVVGVRAFVALEPGVVSARSVTDGRELWSTPLAVEGTPVASATLLVVPARGALHAILADSGQTAWVAPVDPLTAPPLMVGGWLFAATPGRLTAFRVTDGVAIWQREFAEVRERPAAEGTTLYVPTADGRLTALDVASGRTLWEARVGTSAGEPLALSDRVYLGAGRDFVCLKADRGREDWRFAIGAPIRGAPAFDDSHVYIVAMDNLLRAHDRTNGANRWKADLKYRPLAGPVVLGNAVVVAGMTTELRAFAAATGAPAGKLVLPNAAPMQPAFIASGGGGGLILTVTGSPEGRWTLTAAAPPLPTISAAPLTVLPGTDVPLPAAWPPARSG